MPRSVAQALFQLQWKAAMQEEITALEKNDTWELVDLLRYKVPVGCKWVYLLSLPNGSVDQYKTRLIAGC